mgnify:CR=1 FL=1
MDEYCELSKGYDNQVVRHALEYASKCHITTNHKYDSHSYTIHLKMVYDFGCKFAYLLGEAEIDIALAACWCHDVIEDTRQTYNDVKRECGTDIAETVYALTNEKGRTRAERANNKYYRGIRKSDVATFVKLCDRLANTAYSVSHNQRMTQVYKMEFPHFRQQLYNERFDDMFNELESFM